jgi:hypothetical protein
MERYNLCKQYEKEALDRLYEYLGFNEIISFEEFLDFVFMNAKGTIPFAQIFNFTLRHIVTSFWLAYPEYKTGYIKTFWINPEEFVDKYTKVGTPLDFDSKGLLKYFVKTNYKELVKTKR